MKPIEQPSADTDNDFCEECSQWYPKGEPLMCDCWAGTKEQEDYLDSIS